MKTNLLTAFLIIATICSCSKDEINNHADANEIIGSWRAVSLQINEETATDDAKNSRDALSFLSARNCYVLNFEFKEDNSFITNNSVAYVAISFNTNGTGFDIPCPDEFDTNNGVYTYDNTTLTVVDSSGESITTSAIIEGNIMTIDAAALDFPNIDGMLVLERI